MVKRPTTNQGIHVQHHCRPNPVPRPEDGFFCLLPAHGCGEAGNILDSQPDTLHEPQPGAIEDFGHKRRGAIDITKKPENLLFAENGYGLEFFLGPNMGNLPIQGFTKAPPGKERRWH